jgi:choline kinase
MLEIDGRTILSGLVETLEGLVPRIHVVVGYREELIVEHCARYHRSVVIVRNPEFRTTNTARSVALGARGILRKALFLDGDLVISPESLRGFVQPQPRCRFCLAQRGPRVNRRCLSGPGT